MGGSIVVELFGVSRLVTGVKDLRLDLDEGGTFRDVVKSLANQYPGLIGDVIQPDGETLQPPNVFNLNAKRMIRASQMGDAVSDGDRIILMSMSAGG